MGAISVSPAKRTLSDGRCWFGRSRRKAPTMVSHRWIAGGGALRSLALLVALLAASPAAAGPLDRWNGYIAEASARFGVPAEWIRRVMRAESGGRTTLDGGPIRSRAGAMGLMQLMPRTWSEMRAAHGLGPDPHEPRDNILAGTAYLRAMYDRFGYPGLFAAYNAGPGHYARHLSTGGALPAETTAYLDKVSGGGWTPAAVRGLPIATSPAPPALFALSPGPAQPQERVGSTAGDDLFVIRRGTALSDAR